MLAAGDVVSTATALLHVSRGVRQALRMPREKDVGMHSLTRTLYDAYTGEMFNKMTSLQSCGF